MRIHIEKTSQYRCAVTVALLALLSAFVLLGQGCGGGESSGVAQQTALPSQVQVTVRTPSSESFGNPDMAGMYLVSVPILLDSAGNTIVVAEDSSSYQIYAPHGLRGLFSRVDAFKETMHWLSVSVKALSELIAEGTINTLKLVAEVAFDQVSDELHVVNPTDPGTVLSVVKAVGESVQAMKDAGTQELLQHRGLILAPDEEVVFRFDVANPAQVAAVRAAYAFYDVEGLRAGFERFPAVPLGYSQAEFTLIIVANPDPWRGLGIPKSEQYVTSDSAMQYVYDNEAIVELPVLDGPFNAAPALEITLVEPAVGTAGTQVTFRATTAGPAPTAWQWNFGSGAEPSSSNAKEPVVTLGEVGTYNCMVEVWSGVASDIYSFTLEIADSSMTDGHLDPIDGSGVAGVVDIEPNTGVVGTPVTITVHFTSGAEQVAGLSLYSFGFLSDWVNPLYEPYANPAMVKTGADTWVSSSLFGLIWNTNDPLVVRFYARTTAGVMVAVGDVAKDGGGPAPPWESDGVAKGASAQPPPSLAGNNAAISAAR